MYWNVLPTLGGIGLFLIGMLLLTGGLRTLAGARLRSILGRFTSTPATGAATGAVTTAAIQSSSATTVAAVGFVASGLLTFPQALGIIFGANIGTTMTGWLVAILGFKLDLGQAMLPVILVGALLALSGRRKISYLGQALAGFSLIFIGIEQMKSGLETFQGIVTPADFPSDSFTGRLKLVAVGVLITLVTQSSSAGVATALAALSAGAVNFQQAAALVIGMDVGTTFTAVLATLGGGTMARRTGVAHVIYNLMTGVLAFFLLGPFAAAVSYLAGSQASLTALVAFHSVFNLLGVIFILPFARPFARLIEFLIPDRGAALTQSLDHLILRDPAAATTAAKVAVDRLTTAAIHHLRSITGAPGKGRSSYEWDQLTSALAETRTYLDKIKLSGNASMEFAEIKGMYHILDHLDRLLYRCTQTDRISELPNDMRLRRLTGVLTLATANAGHAGSPDECEQLLNRVRRIMRQQRESQRDRLISEAADGTLPDETAWLRLDAVRWLHRVAYHLWRIRLHLNLLESGAAGTRLKTLKSEEAKQNAELN
ncbi:Na/Pi cotransporter family protein [Leisingera aquimarina]|uniref:Na/Pi cotransporter family protein n=1 Tax=Leisingera aquimarina TaxID=476529 RepID=UPI0004143C9F|nr:Na/Pi symporter [Leisingera aquimarina]